MIATKQYQYYGIEEHKQVINLVMKHQLATAIYMTIRQNCDYNTGFIRFSMSDFKHLDLWHTVQNDRVKFTRAVQLLEDLNFIQKIKSNRFGIEVIVKTYCNNDETMDYLDTVNISQKNLITSETMCNNLCNNEDGIKHLDDVCISKCENTTNVTKNETHDHLRLTINDDDTMQHNSKFNLQNDDDELKPIHPTELYKAVKQKQIEQLSKVVPEEFKKIGLSRLLSDQQIDDLYLNYLAEASKKSISNPTKYWTAIVNNFTISMNQKVEKYTVLKPTVKPSKYTKKASKASKFKFSQYNPNSQPEITHDDKKSISVNDFIKTKSGHLVDAF